MAEGWRTRVRFPPSPPKEGFKRANKDL